MGRLEKRLNAREWPQHPMAQPPAGSELKPVMGDAGLPIIGHMVEMFRGGADFWLRNYRKHGPVMLLDSPIMPTVAALGPDAGQAIYSNRNKDFSQQGWTPMIGAFFNRGLMLLDFEEHVPPPDHAGGVRPDPAGRIHRAGRQGRLEVVANDWVANDPRFLLYPAMKELTLDIASMVFMGHEPGTDHELVTKVNKAFTVTTRAGNAIIRTGVPPFTWWRGLQGARVPRGLLRGARQGAARQGRLGPVVGAVPNRGRGRQQVLRRGHRQPHDLPDDGGARHVDVDGDDDGPLPGREPRVAAALPRRIRPARRRPARHRGAGEAGIPRPGDERVAPMVSPVQWAMRRTVRDTELLGYYLPEGTNVIYYPG